MREFVLEMVQKLDERKIKKMIMNQKAVIRKALNMDGKPKWQNPYAREPEQETKSPGMREKPRDRYMRKKELLEQKFKQNLQDTYIQRYSDISTETAQFYKSQAIQLYMTEQFCRGSKYSGSKYTNLIERTTEAMKP